MTQDPAERTRSPEPVVCGVAPDAVSRKRPLQPLLLDLEGFPIRPPPFRGESLLGFLERFIAANGHLLPEWVQPQLERSRCPDN